MRTLLAKPLRLVAIPLQLAAAVEFSVGDAPSGRENGLMDVLTRMLEIPGKRPGRCRGCAKL
jgi:hypothetical protein